MAVLMPLARAGELEQRVIAEAQARLAARALQLRWGPYEPRISAWLPASAERLEPCRQGLRVAPSRDDATPWGRVPYTIRCAEPAWRLRARAEVEVWMEVWAARREIGRNRKLEAADLVLVRTEIGSLYSGFTTDPQQLLGYRTQRSIRAGQVISPGLLEAYMLVREGDNVVIRATAAGMMASMHGTALDDGARQQEVKVRNHSSGQIISAWVVERGIVETRF